MRQALQGYGYRCYHISARGALHHSDTPLVEVPEIVGDYLFTAPGVALPAL